ncbi:MAG: hypothetical protein JRJ03_16425, partial [Deltaproteobacteria bacterium]|nr:hypothetical protein [Deltaproteobacteria bacterium]
MSPTRRDIRIFKKLGFEGRRRTKEKIPFRLLSFLLILSCALFVLFPSLAPAANYTMSVSPSVSIDESSNATFTISLDKPLQSGDSLEVFYKTVDGTALAGDDYTAVDTSYSFKVGESSHDVTITVNDDAVVENTETFDVQVYECKYSGPDGFCIGSESPPITRTVTINDNDQYTISISNAAPVTEGSVASFTVAVNPAVQTGDTVTVDFSTLDTGTARSTDGDFTAVSDQTITFNGGESSQTVTVTTLDDALVEGQETFPVELSNPTTTTGTVGIGTGSATGTIDSDDSYSVAITDSADVNEGETATFTVTISPAVITGDSVTVNYQTVDGTAVAGSDYSGKTGGPIFGPGDTTQDITVTIIDDADVEIEENFTVELTGASSSIASAIITGNSGNCNILVDSNDGYLISIADSADVPEGGTASFSVTLTPAVIPGDTVNIDYTTLDGTAKQPTDYTVTSGKVKFTPGETTKDITVDTVNDSLVELPESFTVKLSNIQTNAAGAFSRDEGSATILVDEKTTITIDNVSADEGGSATFTVSLGGAAENDVTVDYATSDGTATAGSDYTAASATLTIPKGSMTGTISVPITDDDLIELAETFYVNLSSPSANAAFGDNQGVGTINVQEQAVITIDNVSADEGGSATFTVSLSAPAENAVTVQYSTSGGSATEGSD